MCYVILCTLDWSFYEFDETLPSLSICISIHIVVGTTLDIFDK